MPAAGTVTLYTRSDCHPCDEAMLLLTRMAATMNFRLEAVDVDADPALREQYGLAVPVVAVGGSVIATTPLDATAPLDASALRTALIETLGG